MSRFSRSLTGLATGALLGAALLGVLALGSLVGLTNAAYSLFEWLTRVLPGRVVIFGLETTLRTLEALGLNIKDTSKVTEEAIALTELFVASAVIGLLFFLLTKPEDAERARNRGPALGGAAGVLVLAAVLRVGGTASLSTVLLDAVWVLAVFVAWGWALGRLFQATCAPAAERPPTREPAAASRLRRTRSRRRALSARRRRSSRRRSQAGRRRPRRRPAADAAERLDRRHFIIRMGGLVATFVVLGAEVADILSVEGGPAVAPVTKAPIPFPNADSPVKPVPGTRPEYTPVAEHYRVDIDLTPPNIDASSWRLRISGLVARPLAAHHRPDQARLRGAPAVHHAGVHLQPGGRAAHRDHVVERPLVPRRPRRGAAAAGGAVRAHALAGRVRRGRRAEHRPRRTSG